MTKSLFFRLMGAFAAVILIGMVVVALVTNQVTTNQFQLYITRGGQAWAQRLTPTLAAFYAQNNSWKGVEALLQNGTNSPRPFPNWNMGSGMMGRDERTGAMMDWEMWSVMDLRLMLTDPQGNIIADSTNDWNGRTLPASVLQGATPIQVNGRTVGLLVVTLLDAPRAASTPAGDFLSSVNRSILLAALVSGVLALALGFLLFRQITAPLDTLTQATQKIAAGDLRTRAVVRGEDEISRLGRSFNVMAENLEHSETARRNMLADVSHEIRNPLGVIQSHLEAMLDGVFPTNTEQIASLHDETLLLKRLVDDLRDLALADAGQLSLHRETTDLRLLVERTVEMSQSQATEHQIELRKEMDGSIITLYVDRQRIEQVLRNLISNALRYSHAGARVIVKLSQDQNRARVQVSDTGPGIPADALTHVFERFWRGDKSRARALGGSGLGLAIAKQWIDAHGGEIGVTSQIGQGTTFWFTLPIGIEPKTTS